MTETYDPNVPAETCWNCGGDGYHVTNHGAGFASYGSRDHGMSHMQFTTTDCTKCEGTGMLPKDFISFAVYRKMTGAA